MKAQIEVEVVGEVVLPLKIISRGWLLIQSLIMCNVGLTVKPNRKQSTQCSLTFFMIITLI